ncbi:MAG: hypothetical protein SFW67_28815 [Myxococcaceae bacterium]|nr:hypothetical protein [Myxococcaceae bacterium]
MRERSFFPVLVAGVVALLVALAVTGRLGPLVERVQALFSRSSPRPPSTPGRLIEAGVSAPHAGGGG